MHCQKLPKTFIYNFFGVTYQQNGNAGLQELPVLAAAKSEIKCPAGFLEQIWNVLLSDVKTLRLRPVTYADQLLSNIDLTEAYIA